MKKSISKENVIKALRKENLERYDFFHSASDKNCQVCAVGAILRHMSFEKWADKVGIDRFALGNAACAGYGSVWFSNVPSLLARGNYLGALSSYFESGKTKTQCIAFVKKHFPKVLVVTVEIDEPF